MADIISGISGAAKGAASGSAFGPVGSVIGGVGGLLGGLFGGKREKSPAEIAADKYLKDLTDIGVPPQEALKATYERFKSAGELTPEMEQTFLQADSEMKSIQEDPALREGQTRALEALRRESEQGGMTLEDRLAINEANMAADAKAKGASDAILQNMQARGQSGAGAELALRAMNAQANESSNAMRSAQVAADARKRALDAVLNAGNLSGNIRSQDFSQAARTAEAQDAINRFNTANRQSVEGSNIGARNEAQASNLANKQSIMNQNTELTNKEANNAVQALKDQRGMQVDLAKSKYDARTGRAKSTGEADTAAAERKGKNIESVASNMESIANSGKDIVTGAKKIKDWIF